MRTSAQGCRQAVRKDDDVHSAANMMWLAHMIVVTILQATDLGPGERRKSWQPDVPIA